MEYLRILPCKEIRELVMQYWDGPTRSPISHVDYKSIHTKNKFLMFRESTDDMEGIYSVPDNVWQFYANYCYGFKTVSELLHLVNETDHKLLLRLILSDPLDAQSAFALCSCGLIVHREKDHYMCDSCRFCQ